MFALHLYAFILALLSMSVLFAQLEAMLGGDGLRSPVLDKILSLFNVAACGTYLFLALPRVYDTRGWRRWLATIVLTATIAILFVGYRFAIFLISFATT